VTDLFANRDSYGFVTFRHADEAYHAIESKLKYCWISYHVSLCSVTTRLLWGYCYCVQ